MEGVLYKEEEGYYVYVNTVILGTTRPLLNFDLVKHKLCLHNCEEIERDDPKNDLDGWDVEIEMEKVKDQTKMIGSVKGVKGSGHKITTYKSVPKIDENGCLILKRK